MVAGVTSRREADDGVYNAVKASHFRFRVLRAFRDAKTFIYLYPMVLREGWKDISNEGFDDINTGLSSKT